MISTLAAVVLAGSVPLSAPVHSPAELPSASRIVIPDPGPSSYGSAARPGADEPRARLTIGYMADAGFAAAVKLTCGPDAGGHPKPAETCALLGRAGGDPSKIVPATTACYLLYSPVTAEVTGTWRGKPVAWKHRFGNACEMRRATGILFQF
jgi:hypothetical protein